MKFKREIFTLTNGQKNKEITIGSNFWDGNCLVKSWLGWMTQQSRYGKYEEDTIKGSNTFFRPLWDYISKVWKWRRNANLQQQHIFLVLLFDCRQSFLRAFLAFFHTYFQCPWLLSSRLKKINQKWWIQCYVPPSSIINVCAIILWKHFDNVYYLRDTSSK